MASEIYEDIERLSNSINPKVRETMREIRALDFEIAMVKKRIDDLSESFFSTITIVPRYDRINGALEIEKMHKQVIEIANKKIEIVQQTKQLLGKYVIKVNEKLAQFREKMDEDYPGTSQNIEKKVANQMTLLNQMFYNTDDAKACYKTKGESMSVVVNTKNDIINRNDPHNHLTNYYDIIPSYNNSVIVSTGGGGGSIVGANVASSSQPPPLTALKQSRGKNVASKSLKGSTGSQTKNKNKQTNNNNNSSSQSTTSTLVSAANLISGSFKGTTSNSSITTTNTPVNKSMLTPNKNQRKRKATDDNPLNTSTSATNIVDIPPKLPALSDQTNKLDNPLNVISSNDTVTITNNMVSSTLIAADTNSIIINDASTHTSIDTNAIIVDDASTNKSIDTSVVVVGVAENKPLLDKTVETFNTTTTTATEEYSKVDQDLFCLCKQPSYGEMIGCDSDNCTIGWFHLECVALAAAPEGEWYCSNCALSRKTTSKPEQPPTTLSTTKTPTTNL